MYNIESRRYTGSKAKLAPWIISLINKECKGKTFTDIFAGTGVVAAAATKIFDNIIINDFLYSNYAIYKAFFDKGKWNRDKIYTLINKYNAIDSHKLKSNYFSYHFGNRYFEKNTAKLIGFIREDIERNKKNLTEKEYYIILASLLYSADKIANTVGHYDAYIKKPLAKSRFILKLINPIKTKKTQIHRTDTNLLAKTLKADIVYIDPPYNSRQYSRFYHLLETLTKWKKPKLYGTALKPKPENTSDYCKVKAPAKFAELINDLNCKYIVVSYNNTYNSKSHSSRNKMKLEEISKILNSKGPTQTFKKPYRYFNSGRTRFDNHHEYIFITKVNR